METVVVRVWLPDRPGALGQVASRVGAVRGDVVGIEILERGGGNAIDELTVTLPEPGLLDLLVSEIRQVDGVAVEHVRVVAPGRPEGSIAALGAVESIVRADPSQRADVVVASTAALMDADWVLMVDVASGEAVATLGEVPSAEWTMAFIAGTTHLGAGHDTAPGDLAWAPLHERGLVLACGRGDRVVLARERHELQLLARICDGLR